LALTAPRDLAARLAVRVGVGFAVVLVVMYGYERLWTLRELAKARPDRS
jgi:hypothetical protein